jgi:protocatechuate 3,4-dioxygenase, beta subunit
MRLQYFSILIALLSMLSACRSKAQTKSSQPGQHANEKIVVGGNFENREFTYYGISKNISAVDTSPGWNLQGSKLLLTGAVFAADAKTLAPGVLVYYYHTNTAGRYQHRPAEARSMPPNETGQTHGYIRGWVKTDSAGRYSIYTTRPGVYPATDEPAHIHLTVKEPNNISEYYIDEFVFDDDPFLNTAKRRRLENRAGSGILRLVQKDGVLVGERNIILGLNIPDYPVQTASAIKSGNHVGEDVISFTPFHAWGPDKGTKTCPVCKYGWYHGILYCVGNNPDWTEIKTWLRFLEEESQRQEKYLKVYFVYGNEKGYNPLKRTKELETIGKELNLEKVALTHVPGFSDQPSEIYLNQINPDVDNTMLLYKRSRIIGKFVNLKPTADNFQSIKDQLGASINEYFYMPSKGKE